MNTPSAFKLREAFAQGETTAEKIIENSLQRIRKLDGEIGAFLKVLNERALKQAQALDTKRREGKPLGKLAGVPIAIKDNMHICGEITTCGSRFLTNYRAPFDATVVRLLEAEDALIIGKTNLDEFAMGSSTEHSAFHMTKNPLDLTRSPGGSSGGSAAAVCAGFCPLALGSDTGGSIRQPASFCGIVGFKPTYGRVSRYGLVAFGSSFDQIGPFSTTVKDTALIMDILAQHCELDSTSLETPNKSHLSQLEMPLKGKKIGVPWSYLENLDETVAKHFKESLKRLEALGAQIVEVKLPILKHSIACYYILSTAEASTNLARFDGIRYGVRSEKATTLDEIYDLSREDGFGAEVKSRILLGTFVLSSGHKDDFYKKAQQVRTLFIEEFKTAFSECSLMAMPTTPKSAFKIGAMTSSLEEYLQDTLTTPINIAGLPAISIPSGYTFDSMPLSLQLIGPSLHDAEVLNAAHAYETMRGETK